jgi:hypothetical protein
VLTLAAITIATSAFASASASRPALFGGTADPVITVTAGGDRVGATSVAGLAGERFDFYAGRQGTPPSGSPTATCVTSSSGKCSVSVPTQSGGSGGSTLGYWVVQSSVPAGWFPSDVLDVGKGGAEVPADYQELFVANVRSDINVPIADTGNGSNPTARQPVGSVARQSATAG